MPGWWPRWKPLLGGALAASVLFVLGELAPLLYPVWISVEARDQQVVVTLEGREHVVQAPPNRRWLAIELQEPGPEHREYQIDGSDTTTRRDRDPDHIRAIQGSPLYGFAAWLRDEGSYSRWEHLRLIDTSDGREIAVGRNAVQAAALPAAFRIEAALRRPEASVGLWLVSSEPRTYGGLEINRNGRFARWMVGPQREDEALRWFFPEEAVPFAASLMHLVGRSVAGAYVFFLGAGLGALLLAHVRPLRVSAALVDRLIPASVWLIAPLVLFGMSAWIAFRLYHQLPHVVDAVSYYRQSLTFLAGRLWLEAPPLVEKFTHYHQVVWEGRWFSQYAPGAPAAYAAGGLLGLAWLVGPLATVILLVATALVGYMTFGSRVAVAVLALGAISPFMLFQAGAFMSHPLAGAALACGLAAFTRGERTARSGWYLAAGVCIGAGFLTREIAAVLFAFPLGVWLLAHRRWQSVMLLAAGALPFLIVYGAYNVALTGHPLTLPRHLYEPMQWFGFETVSTEDRTRHWHTLAAGLVNTDENLTLLQFDLFGWPPLFALGLLALPFLLGRATRHDCLLGGGALLFPAAYMGYFGHGIMLGPRYYYEALPILLLLSARGLQSLAATLRSLGSPTVAARVATASVAATLSLSTVFYYVPRLVERRMDYGALAGKQRLEVPFVENTLLGPRLVGVPSGSLVLVPDENIFKTIGALNCPLLDREHAAACPVLFMNGGADDVERVNATYPGRALLHAVLESNVVHLRLGPPR